MNEVFPHSLDPVRLPQMGLVVLKSDETAERDFRDLLPREVELLVSRVPAADEVTRANLAEIANHLTQATALFPTGVPFSVLGYACTSGSAELGEARVEALMTAAASTRAVTNPLSALVAACGALEIRTLGLLTPYAPEVAARMREALQGFGLEVPVYGSFSVPQEAMVVRIDSGSILFGAAELAQQGRADAIFLSCTNLRTLSLIPRLEAQLGIPVMSSNQVLAWHMLRLAGFDTPGPGQLFSCGLPVAVPG